MMFVSRPILETQHLIVSSWNDFQENLFVSNLITLTLTHA